MRLARCDACGSKAMLAASQCPRCAQPLYLRNDRGDNVPLTRCRGCNTYYPQSRDSCRWCAADPPPARGPRLAATLGGIVVLAGAALGVARFLPAGSLPHQPDVTSPTGQYPASQMASREPDAARLSPVTAVPVAVMSATQPLRSSRAAGTDPRDTSSRRTAMASRSTDSAGTQPQPSNRAEGTEQSDTSSSRSGLVSQATDTLPTGDGRGRLFARATTWVNVRAESNSESSVVGIIRPDSIVEVGELHRGWRRITTKSLSGWAAAKLLLVDSTLRGGS